MTPSPPVSRVGLIIVTFNSRKYFPRLKAALETQTVPFTLYVLDNGSRPEERPHAADFPAGAQIIQSDTNLGFAAGNNKAAALWGGEFVVLLNPDAFPNPDWLERLLEATERWPDAVAFGSTQISGEDSSRFDGLGDCYSVTGVPWRGGFGWPVTTPRKEGEIFSPCAAAALYRTQAWRDLGGFDESYFCYCEDVDLGFRFRLAGKKCVQAPEAVVTHIGGASSGRRSHFAVFHGTRNRMWTYMKNMPPSLLIASFPSHVAITVAFLLFSLFSGTSRATWSGVAAGLRGLPRILRERAQVQAKRQANSLQLGAAMSWSPSILLSRAPFVRQAPRKPA